MTFASKLNEVIQQVYGSTNVEEAKQLMIDCVSNSQINDYSKNRMITTVGTLKTLKDVQFYATNSMFMYEGLGVGAKRKISEGTPKKEKAAVDVKVIIGNLDI